MKGIASIRLPDDTICEAELHWYEAHGIGKKEINFKRSSVAGKRVSARRSSTSRAARPVANAAATSPHFAVCVRNDDYRASLELRKLYAVLNDDFAEQHDMIRIIDESGEDYLYPQSYFVRVELPRAIEQALVKIA